MKTRLFNQIVKALVAIIFLTYYFAGCEKEEPDDEIIPKETFEAVISKGGNYENTGETFEEDTLLVPIDSTINSVNCICSVTHYDVLAESNKQLLFENQSGVIYPGNLLQGNSLTNEIPSLIVVERAAGTISYNLNDGNLQSFFKVEQVTKSSIQNAMNHIISQAGETVPADFIFDYEEVHSTEQLALSLGLDVKYGKFKMASQLDFSKEKQYNRYLVKLTQIYYSMSFDLPTSYDKLFAPSVTAADLSKYIYAGNPATYISEVAYGRFFYMLIESTSSSEEMKAAIDASFSGIAKVAVEAEVNKMENLSELKVKVIAYGGDAKGTMAINGLKDIRDIAERLAQSTDIKAGLPISYVVRNVENNEIVNIRMAAEYDVYNCEPLENCVVDIEGNVYKTIRLENGMVWMAENLKTTRYNDGAYISYIYDTDGWVKGDPGYCYPNNDPTYKDEYGCLYNGKAVDKQKLAPEGWHIPTEEEWKNFREYAGGENSGVDNIKEAGTSHWNAPNTASNNTGFTALPAGFRDRLGQFDRPGNGAYFWASSKTSPGNIVFIRISSTNKKFEISSGSEIYGFSVRCIKD